MRRVCMLLLLLSTLFAFGQTAQESARYSNKHLFELGVKLEKQGVPLGKAGEYQMVSVSLNKKVYASANDKGVINQIGFSLFQSVLKQGDGQLAFFSRFVERYILELVLLDEQAMKRKLWEDRVKISMNSSTAGNLLGSLKQFVNKYTSQIEVNFATQFNFASVQFKSGKLELLRMVFPISYELLTGYTKMESENRFSEVLSDYVCPPSGLSEDGLSVYKDNILIRKGETFNSESILSTSYYVSDNLSGKRRLQPLFDSAYMPESVYTLFNGEPVRNDVSVAVTQSLYGNKKKNFTCPLSQLIGYMRSKGCNIYTGISKADAEGIEGVVVANNEQLGYQHIMTFRADAFLFTDPSGSSINATLYSYIPIHNMKSFYSENLER